MRRSLPLVTMMLVLLIFLGGREPDTGSAAEAEPVSDFDHLKKGMSPDEVRKLLGSPKRIARQILYHRHVEQWIYDLPHRGRVHFDCPRGSKPQLIWKRGTPVENK
jgi:hypothetical protein